MIKYQLKIISAFMITVLAFINCHAQNDELYQEVKIAIERAFVKPAEFLIDR